VTKDLCSKQWIRRKRWPKITPRARRLKLVDLFCGCGGLSLGAFEAARVNDRAIEVALALDKDETAISVYRSNFQVGKKVACAGDILDIFSGNLKERLTSEEKILRKKCGQVHLLIAGPPCQGHSDLNNSSRRKDPRNSLYMRVVRAAKILRPKAVMIENVPTIIHDRGRIIARATNALAALGYKVSTTMIGAASIGLPQTRRRHILIAVRGKKFDFGFLDAAVAAKPATVRDYIDDLRMLNGDRVTLFDEASGMSEQNVKRARFLYSHNKYDLPNRLRPKCHRLVEHSYVSMYGRLHWNRPAQTITGGFGSMGQGRFLHPSRCRTITPHEAARLQGFPDFFGFDKVTSRVAMQTTIGNAVPPKLAAVFVDQLVKCRYI
jgi:DNA (cytosine-5)-methyltransferase 1